MILIWVNILLVIFSDSTRPNYVRFESHDVQSFRKRVVFVSPIDNPNFVQQYKVTTLIHGEEKKLRSNIESDFGLDRMLRLHIENNAKIKLVNGFRIQIYSGSNQKESAQTRLEFLELFPNVPVFSLYERPYFKVRAGEFTSRLEVEAFLKTVKQYFQGAFIVPDKVELLKNN